MKKQFKTLKLKKHTISSLDIYSAKGGLENTITKASGCSGCPICTSTPVPIDPRPITKTCG